MDHIRKRLSHIFSTFPSSRINPFLPEVRLIRLRLVSCQAIRLLPGHFTAYSLFQPTGDDRFRREDRLRCWGRHFFEDCCVAARLAALVVVAVASPSLSIRANWRFSFRQSIGSAAFNR